MGNYFMMSFRFNKSSPEDFGLISSEEANIFIRPSDNTFWEKCDMYDFGWGKENGYRRVPLLEFPELVDLILHTNSENDKYGAAVQILEKHTDELLALCKKIFEAKNQAKRYKEFFEILRLDDPINRSPTMGKTNLQISNDYEQWAEISSLVKRII